jgi:hypothetical protein
MTPARRIKTHGTLLSVSPLRPEMMTQSDDGTAHDAALAWQISGRFCVH